MVGGFNLGLTPITYIIDGVLSMVLLILFWKTEGSSSEHKNKET